MPATSQEPSGSGRRKRVSARHQVKRLDRIFDRACSFRKPVRQKKEVFFIGADPKVRNFTGALRQLRFGPDVFADALVPQAGAMSPAVLIPENPKKPVSSPPGFMPRTIAAMVIALPNRKVNRIPQTPR
jgi:hypothetical protein